MSTLRRLLELTAAPRPRVALASALGTVTVLCGVGLMAAAGYLISRAAERPAVLSLTVAIVTVRAFGLARPVARYAERLASHDLAFRALSGARVHAYERIEPLAPAQLGGYRDGDLLSRMVADVDELQNLHLRGIGPALVAVSAGALSAGAAAALLPEAGLVLACGLIIAGTAVPALSTALARRGGPQQAEARGELTADLVEVLRAGPELVVYGCEQERLSRLRAADDRLVRIARRAALTDGTGDALRLLVTGATVAGVLAVAVAAHAAGHLDRVMIAAVALLAVAAFEAVGPLPAAARELSESLTAGRRVLDLVDRAPAVTDPAEPAPPPAAPYDIALEGVSSRGALDGLDLRLDEGRRVALVGPSGIGKTTVADLLIRFADPERGRVVLSGRDLREYRQEDVRRAVSVVGQDAHMFATSINENVRLARPGADDAQVALALARAQIGPWVASLPEGGATLVGEGGRELSGGQRQRIAVARALLADSPVMVLDEPTAHLDPPAAEALIRDVVAGSPGRTLVLITHRPEGLEHMDEIVRLG
jgi:ATP-binding cassette, subfamily C, bacterial CydC